MDYRDISVRIFDTRIGIYGVLKVNCAMAMITVAEKPITIYCRTIFG